MKKKHEICERIARIAKAHEISDATLAELSGLSSGHVWNILHGKTRAPRFDTVCRLVNALDMGEATIVEQRQKEPNVYKLKRRA